MELNREQIIKALECCTINKSCDGCPIFKESDYCIDILAPNVLTLIKELTEDMERVRKQCGEIIVECDERDAERLKQVAELTDENATLNTSCTELTRKCASLTEENERLRERVKAVEESAVRSFESQQDLYRKMVDALNRENHEAKADTVRKMQEMLKAQKFTHKNFGELVYVEDIDQITKELTLAKEERDAENEKEEAF